MWQVLGSYVDNGHPHPHPHACSLVGSSPSPLCLSSLNLDLGQEHGEEVAGEGVQL